MQTTLYAPKPSDGVHTFVRNRYFYGKLLDVFHFELESDYLNGKRWLLNRLISGYGVLCGLDVQVAPSGRAVVVTPGVALDRAGHEIIVPRTSDPVTLPPRPATSSTTAANCDPEDFVHLCICFEQCEGDPTPIMVDNCGQAVTCASSSYQERYRCVIRDCKAPDIQMVTGLPDLIMNGRLNYHALVERVTRGCPALPTDVCIPLANIRLPSGEDPPSASDIDISPRPIVYSNDLLFDMFLALGGDAPPRNRGGKQ